MTKHTILLVEDDELDVISVRRSLDKLDIPLVLYTAFNGVEALEMLGTMDPLPDILLLDLNMPRMSGLELLTALRSDDRFRHIKVFVMTTSGQQSDREATENLGVAGYLVKPMGYGSHYNREGSMEHFVQFHMRNILMSL